MFPLTALPLGMLLFGIVEVGAFKSIQKVFQGRVGWVLEAYRWLSILHFVGFMLTLFLPIGVLVRSVQTALFVFFSIPYLLKIIFALVCKAPIKTAFVVMILSVVGLGSVLVYGMVEGAYRYQVRRSVVKIKNLPASFDGFKIVHISDFHIGSLWRLDRVGAGVRLINAQKANVVFFTGDYVNSRADEMTPFLPMLKTIKAPLGVFCILGNHDYGTHNWFATNQEKARQGVLIQKIPALLGWQLLRNQHQFLHRGADSIAVLGVENWGDSRQNGRHGNLPKAYAGTERVAVKLLLSHDPLHWQQQVTQDFKDIAFTFSGHTHGMQIGFDNAVLRWSPMQYIYAQWAGIYQIGFQYLNVNRGFGVGLYPGRLGIWPEISVIELKKY